MTRSGNFENEIRETQVALERLLRKIKKTLAGKQKSPNNKKVIHYTTLGISAKTFFIPHFQALKDAGFEISLLSNNDADARYATQAAGIRHIPLSILQHISLLQDLKNIYLIYKILREEKPFIFHAHMSKAGFTGMIASFLAGVPVRIYHNHGMVVVVKKGLLRSYLWTAERISTLLAGITLFCSKSSERIAQELHIVTPGTSMVLGEGSASGIDSKKLDFENKESLRAAIRKELDVTDSTVVIGFLGRLIKHKQIHLLIEAFDALPQEQKVNAKLLLVGMFDAKEPDIKKIVDERVKLNNEVVYLPFTDNISKIYAGLDILVNPSLSEGFGNTLLEAAFMEIPTIGSNVVGICDAVVDAETGLLFESNNREQLTNTFKKFIEDKNLRELYGRNGRQRVLKHFLTDHVVQQMVAFYKQIDL
jgi:glycosyltransferase involved in cell wall biosynthesis